MQSIRNLYVATGQEATILSIIAGTLIAMVLWFPKDEHIIAATLITVLATSVVVLCDRVLTNLGK